MLNIRKIIYATDFSKCSENAFPVAVRLASLYDAELHMLHAIVLHADDPHDPAHHFPEPDELYERMRDSAATRMASTAENDEMPDLKVVQAQVRGISPAPVILEYAEEQDIDLIVMGTHGRRGLRHLLLGSVAEEVVRLSECPVVTVHEDEFSAVGFQNILVPMDYSESSEAALGHAAEIGAKEGARLHLLHVLEVGTYPDFYFPVQATQMFDMPELKRKALEHLGKRVEGLGPAVETELHVELGHPAQNIAEYAERLSIDLIVIASHGRTGLERALLGSVAEGTVRRAKCAVLTVKPFGKDLRRPE
ncbi:MAG: universal stress protein [Gemmatimonadota bacterium]|nr:MAG: universal stress protein [Gemmatimonadota bacterium]